MTDQDAWFELYKAIIMSGKTVLSTAGSADYYFKMYKDRWKVCPEITIVWEDSRPLTTKELRSETNGLSPGKYLLVLIPRRRRLEMEALFSFVERSTNWRILVDDNIIGASERALFAFTSEEEECAEHARNMEIFQGSDAWSATASQ